MALWRSTAGLHPEIVPSSVLKMNRATPDVVPLETTKPVVPLKTTPVGAAVVPAGLPPGGGTVTTSGIGVPAPLYSVEKPVPLSEIQNGEVGLCTIPQGLTRCGSVTLATPGKSDTKLVCW